MKKTIENIDLSNKTVVFRADFNVPLDDNQNITDDKRIVSTLPSINYILSKNAKIVLLSHLGRPIGVDKKFSLSPVYNYLKNIYKDKIIFAQNYSKEQIIEKAHSLKNGQILLLENVRFDPQEEENGEELALFYASLGDIFVNDAFATAHRKHASTYGIAKNLPAVAGFLMGEEINSIFSIISNPERPFTAIIGGSKISDKIGLISALIEKCDNIIVGGAMAFTFIKAIGGEVGASKFESDSLDEAKKLLEKAHKLNKNLMLPIDVKCAYNLENDKTYIFNSFEISKDMAGFDIGEESIKNFCAVISSSKTIVWNGPLGVFENENFCNGTQQVAQCIADSNAKSLIGGGDTASAIKKFGLTKSFTHISTGGGASLKLIENENLPCVEVLENL